MGYCETERQDLKDYHNFQKCFISNGELYPLCKEKKKNVMIAVFMRILKNTILHIQRNKKASL